MRYSEDGVFVLNGLTFKIMPNMKVGVVGRTGAGKSSIIQTLFRMVEVDNRPDSFIKIDGIDIKDIGLKMLRSNLSIIP